MKVGKGVTRTVWSLGPNWVVKIPNWGCLVRGYLANQSEWRQRHRPDVAPPVLSIFNVALIMGRAERNLLTHVERIGPPADIQITEDGVDGHRGDEAKLCSWGYYPESGWRLIDYDRAWDPDQRSPITGRLYYWNQERLARKWSKL